MRYDEKSGIILISLTELITLSLCRLASESAADGEEFAPRPIEEHLRKNYTASDTENIAHEFEEAGHRFRLLCEADEWREDGFLLLRRLPCDPTAPSKEVVRRLRGETFALAHLYFLAHPEKSEVKATVLRFGAQASAWVKDEETVTKKDAEKFFARLVSCLGRAGSEEVRRVSERLPTLRSLRFPFPSVRTSQKDLIDAVWRTVKRHGRLYACAPTGTGKTAAVLYPALRALGDGLTERVFYLTPTGTASLVAVSALERFTKAGAKLRAVLLTAKERICARKAVCRELGSTCRLGRKNGESEEEAAAALLAKEMTVIGPKEIREVAAAYGVCPYELSLRYSLFCDVIVGDYNYLFDPAVALRRYFDRPGHYTFLIDEAHDLVERAREIASASLSSEEISAFSCALRTLERSEADAVAERIERAYMRTLRVLEGEQSYTDAEGVAHTFHSNKQTPEELQLAIETSSETVVRLAADRTLPYEAREILRRSFYPLRDLARAANAYDAHYESFYERHGEGLLLRLICLDPGSFIDTRLAAGDSAVLFSATLDPLDYYRTVLGGGRQSEELLLDSPFDGEHLAVAVTDRISTRYVDREESAHEIAAMIEATANGQVGNYLVFCPSYAYLDTLSAAFRARCPKVRCLMSPRTPDRRAREAFLSEFKENPTETLVGFAVTGGVFAEGIDLVGTRLIGAVVVGVSLPQPSPERDAMTAYYDEIYERGKEFSYIYPGMNRVLQAAGRVIRTEEDRGVLVLIDDRFREPLYRRMIPSHWRGLKFVGDANALSYVVKKFWKE